MRLGAVQHVKMAAVDHPSGVLHVQPRIISTATRAMDGVVTLMDTRTHKPTQLTTIALALDACGDRLGHAGLMAAKESHNMINSVTLESPEAAQVTVTAMATMPWTTTRTAMAAARLHTMGAALYVMPIPPRALPGIPPNIPPRALPGILPRALPRSFTLVGAVQHVKMAAVDHPMGVLHVQPRIISTATRTVDGVVTLRHTRTHKPAQLTTIALALGACGDRLGHAGLMSAKESHNMINSVTLEPPEAAQVTVTAMTTMPWRTTRTAMAAACLHTMPIPPRALPGIPPSGL